jgi:hypothetical protein
MLDHLSCAGSKPPRAQTRSRVALIIACQTELTRFPTGVSERWQAETSADWWPAKFVLRALRQGG